ncbi:MAG: lytic transglycosylase domain-containing protein [Lentisphaerae bacterium]|nr:lytic transglycosylase domain-containing protein [Lentisphaerota bacterium]
MRGGLLRLTWRAVAWDVGIAAAMIVIGLGVLYWRAHRFDGAFEEAGTAHNVDPDLLRAIAWKESRFDPGALGKAGEVGLMQVTSVAAADWAAAEKRPKPSRHELLDPRTNVRAGAWYIGRAIRRWSERPDPLPFALAEYNAGLSNADRWALNARDSLEFWNRIGFPTTKRYVEDILKRYRGGVVPPPAPRVARSEAK